MSASAISKNLARAFGAFVAVTLLAALVAPVAAFAMPPSPALLQRSKTDAALKASIDQYIYGAKPAGLDQPSALLDVTTLRSSWLATSPSSSKLSAGIYDVTVGGFRQLVLLVDFSDKPAVVSSSFFDNLIFKDTVGPSSVRGYYREVSAGALDILPVAEDLPSARGWLRMPQPYSYYCPVGSKGQGAYPDNAQKMAEDAMAAADAAGVDFSNYDNNHDGVVDGVVIVHSGKGQEMSGNAADIWSQKWSVRISKIYDGVRTSGYTTEPEYWTTPGDMTTGVYCHELGHTFGLPDLYDTDNSSAGIGSWSLMAYGSWNGVNGASPSRPDAYSMLKLGFATASQVTSASAAVTIRSANASSTGDIYRIEESGATGGKQYFLVENRQKTGTDAGLPGSGLLIWHVDESMSNNNNEAHYMVDLEEAHGGTQNLAVKTNYGDAGDTFPGTGAKKTFSDLTDPNSKYYDGTGDVMVSNISASSTSMSALMVRDRVNLDVTPPVTTSDAAATYDTAATISLTATDSGSGVASTSWTLDGIAGNGLTVQTSKLGAHTLTYWSVDVAGNVEVKKSATFTITVPDTTAPVTTSDAKATYVNSAVIRLSATDNVGVTATYFTLDDGVQTAGTTINVTTVGSHTIQFWSVDGAGNVETPNVSVFTVRDVTAPAVTSDAASTYTGSASVRVTATDEAGGSGLASISLSLDSRAATTVSSSPAMATCDAPGQHTLAFSALDKAGNRSATSTVTFSVTALVPVAPVPIAEADQVAGGDVSVSWGAVGSAASYEYELNGTVSEPIATANALVSGLAEGENVLRVRALNAYGDAGPWSQSVTVVRVAPVDETVATSTVTVSGSGASAVVNVMVIDGTGAAVSGQQVTLQFSSDQVTWSDLATLTTGVNGIATFAYKATTRTWVRSLVVGADETPDSASPAVKVLAVPGLAKPLTPVSVRHRRTFTISGYLKPRHKAGAHNVTIKLYRYRSGKWRYYKTVKATNANYSSYTKYSVKTTVPTSGLWRAYACYAATADFASAKSGYRQFRVK